MAKTTTFGDLREVKIDTGEPEDDIKVEVVDDTPPEDRGRKPLPQDIVTELENDPLEEYSEKVQQRMKQLKKVWHDERRGKETAEREKQEAIRFAESQRQENLRLRKQLGDGEQVLVNEVQRSAQKEAAEAKSYLQRAYEKGDAKEIADAQEALTKAQLRVQKVTDYQPQFQRDPSLQEGDEGVEAPQRTQPRATREAATPPVDERAAEWKKQNTWFGSNKGMTAFALGLHQELVDAGVDPTSDEYYDKINRATRKRFPEAFESDDENTEREENPRPAPRRQPATVVAPASRSSTPRQVRLTQSQLSLAKKFGLTPEQYAREMIKLEQQNNG